MGQLERPELKALPDLQGFPELLGLPGRTALLAQLELLDQLDPLAPLAWASPEQLELQVFQAQTDPPEQTAPQG